MTNELEQVSEREEIELLLPWYATGRLELEDHRRVETYLATHPEMQRQLDMILDERHATIIQNEAIGRPAPGGLDRLRQSIATESTPVDEARAGLMRWLGEMSRLFTSPTPFAVKWAGAAALALLVIQAAFIGSLVLEGEPTRPGYTTASGEEAGAVAGTRVLVRFQSSASALEIADALSAVGAQIVAGPKPGGLFQVRLSTKSLSEAERDAAIARLRSRDGLIELIIPSG